LSCLRRSRAHRDLHSFPTRRSSDLPQLWHIGMVRQEGQGPFPEAPAVGPSGLRIDGTEAGRTMTQKDIDDVIAAFAEAAAAAERSEEHTSELQSRENLVCRLLLEKK